MRADGKSELRLYAPRGTALDECMHKIEAGIDQNIRYNLENLIPKARKQWIGVQRVLENTPIFVQDFAQAILGAQKLTTSMFIKGVLGHKEESQNINSILPKILGKNPWQLFNLHKGSADESVTIEQTKSILKPMKSKLTELGFKYFDITASLFYTMPEKGFARKFGAEPNTNLEKLVSTYSILPENTFVVLGKVPHVTDFEDYAKSVVPCVFYRHKSSLALKELKLCTGGAKEKKAAMKGKKYIGIKDLFGMTSICRTMDEVDRTQDWLKQNPTIGRSKVTFLDEDDYRKNPKQNTNYDTLCMVLEVSTLDSDPYIVEIKLPTIKQFFRHDIDPKSHSAHKTYKRYIQHLPAKQRAICEFYEPTLYKILGEPHHRIELTEL